MARNRSNKEIGEDECLMSKAANSEGSSQLFKQDTRPKACSPFIGKYIPPQFLRKELFGEFHLQNLCHGLGFERPNIQQLNLRKLSDQDDEKQNQILRAGYEDMTAKFFDTTKRLSMAFKEKQDNIDRRELFQSNEICRLKQDLVEKDKIILDLQAVVAKYDEKRKKKNRLHEIRRRRTRAMRLNPQLPAFEEYFQN